MKKILTLLLAATIAGCVGGTPGLSTIKSAPSSVWGRCPPSSSCTPASRSCASSAMVSRTSVSVTVAPRRTSSSAAATPLLAAPTTTARLPETENEGFALISTSGW